MKKIVLAVALIAAAAWYFHFGRTMNESSVRKFYGDQTLLLAELDGEPLCKLMTDDYLVKDVSFNGSATERSEKRREEACADIKQSLTVLGKLSNASGGILHPMFEQKIDSIELSDGNKRATVKGVSIGKIGDMTMVRSRFTETLIRRNGKILSQGGESKTWVYGGE
ncbi:hypothetical protein JI752_000470 [Lysobacter sp. MMG2]|uniref:hypothetical protein n=1 Tax=Lysobacter sp. MMG2 TaxID=2801338 RepID=UPI001C22581A|nr:hypothetical protein [Lysobacter sp. MMG2]MBU8974602.1 hypothetical protein [Lysobacter sp. MMG2]